MNVAVGAKVPDFKLSIGSEGVLQLSQLCSEHKAVVLHFFPLAFTGG